MDWTLLTAAAVRPQVTWLFAVLTVLQGGLKSHSCVAAHVCLEEKPEKTGRHLSFLVAKAKGEVGWLFKFLWSGQRKESLSVMGRRFLGVRSGNKSKSILYFLCHTYLEVTQAGCPMEGQEREGWWQGR